MEITIRIEVLISIIIVVGIIGVVAHRVITKIERKKDEVFSFVLEACLTDQDETKTKQDKINKVYELCRMTKGKIPAGAYFCLSALEQHNFLNKDND